MPNMVRSTRSRSTKLHIGDLHQDIRMQVCGYEKKRTHKPVGNLMMYPIGRGSVTRAFKTLSSKTLGARPRIYSSHDQASHQESHSQRAQDHDEGSEAALPAQADAPNFRRLTP